MIAGDLRVGPASLRWGERALTIKAHVFWLQEPVRFTLVYAQIAAIGLVSDDGEFRLMVRFQGTQLDLRFSVEQQAHDAACELLRRMEVVA